MGCINIRLLEASYDVVEVTIRNFVLFAVVI